MYLDNLGKSFTEGELFYEICRGEEVGRRSGSRRDLVEFIFSFMGSFVELMVLSCFVLR